LAHDVDSSVSAVTEFAAKVIPGAIRWQCANTTLKIRMVAGPKTGPTPLARKVMNATIRWLAAVVELNTGLEEALLADASATFIHLALSTTTINSLRMPHYSKAGLGSLF
jgi:hypothetical protein